MKAQFEYKGINLTVHFEQEDEQIGDWETPYYPESISIKKIVHKCEDIMPFFEPYMEDFETEFKEFIVK